MSDLNREMDTTLKELALYGIKGSVEEAGKHLKVIWTHASAHGHIVVARSGSDRRGWLNARGEVRRQMREAGIPPLPPEPVTSFKRAMTLPKVEDQASYRLKELEQNFEALLDLHNETRSALDSTLLEVASLREAQIALREQLQSATVQSQLVLQPLGAPAQNVTYKRQPGRSDVILQHLPILSFMNVTELSRLTNMTKPNLASALDYLKKTKRVEKGPRGYWRRLPEAPVESPRPVLLNGAGTTE